MLWVDDTFADQYACIRQPGSLAYPSRRISILTGLEGFSLGEIQRAVRTLRYQKVRPTQAVTLRRSPVGYPGVSSELRYRTIPQGGGGGTEGRGGPTIHDRGGTVAGEGTGWHPTPGGRHCRGNALVQDGRCLRAPNKNKKTGCLQEPAEYHPPVFLQGSNPHPWCMPAMNGSRTCWGLCTGRNATGIDLCCASCLRCEDTPAGLLLVSLIVESLA